MTNEQYEQAHHIHGELDDLYRMLYGHGDVKTVKINSLDVIQRAGTIDRNSITFNISQELSDAIVKVIENRIKILEEQFKNI